MKKVCEFLIIFVLIGAFFHAMLGSATYMRSKEILLYLNEHPVIDNVEAYISNTYNAFTVFSSSSSQSIMPRSVMDSKNLIDFVSLIGDWIMYGFTFVVQVLSSLIDLLYFSLLSVADVLRFVFNFLYTWLFGKPIIV